MGVRIKQRGRQLVSSDTEEPNLTDSLHPPPTKEEEDTSGLLPQPGLAFAGGDPSQGRGLFPNLGSFLLIIASPLVGWSRFFPLLRTRSQ